MSAAVPTNDLKLSFQPGVINMGDHHNHPALALLLEALVATALIGTFFVYGGYPVTHAPAADPAEVAKLTTSR